MVTGKVKFQNYSYGRWFHNPEELANFEKSMEINAAKDAVRSKINAEIAAIRLEVKEALEEKKKLDQQMEHHVKMNTLTVQNQIDEYSSQITRLNLALEICNKSMRASKLELVEQWRKDNPFDKLKILQNKQYNLERKRDRI